MRLKNVGHIVLVEMCSRELIKLKHFSVGKLVVLFELQKINSEQQL